MPDIIDWLTTNGMGLLLIIFAPLVIMGLYIGISYVSTYVSSPLNHVSTQTYCAEIPHGTYTIFPAFLTLLSLGGSTAYASTYLLTACIGSSVSLWSVLIWYVELLPIGFVIEIIRQRVSS